MISAPSGSLLDWLECELAKDEDEESAWATLGTLDHVRDDLKHLLTFFSGVEVTKIKRSLEKLGM